MPATADRSPDRALPSPTSRGLTLKLAAALGLLTLLFASLADFLLYRSLVDQDRGLLAARAANYQRIAAHAGTAKLIEVLAQERPPAERWLIEIDTPSHTGSPPRFTNQPDVGEASAPAQRLSSLHWPLLDTWRKRWLVQDVALSPPTVEGNAAADRLTLGLSSLERQTQQVAYRWAILLSLLPLLIASIALIGWVHRKALQPIRDLIRTTERIHRGQNLSERVPVRDPHSELGQLARQTNDFLATIERLLDGMRAALDNVAHDLRTPMARQRLQIEQLLLDPRIRQQPELCATLADLAEEGQRIEQMLATLMDIAQAESGTLPLQFEPLELGQLLEQVGEIYCFAVEDKGCELRIDCPPRLIVQADALRLRQALLNLLDNALKFAPEHSLIRLDARLDGAPDSILIRVCDEGPGIAEQDLPYIFDRLYRGDQSRSTPGLGLGLSLVKAVVEAHRGTLDVGNRPEGGACFSIRLPLEREQRTAAT